MSRDDIVVGLDIGTTKVCTVVGHGDAHGIITIAGVGVVPSRGIKKGVVIDVEDTVTAIRESVSRASHMAGVRLTSAVAGVTGDHIQSSNRRGTITVSDSDTITQADVNRVLQAAAMDVPPDREIIHSLPRYFAVDGHRGVRRPIGMCGQRLEVETHVVTGTASFLQNVVQCVERAGLTAEALVLEPIATSEAVATPDERELGVALIDIGGGTSDIAVFMDGSIVHSEVISVGGNHVTRDISIGLRTPFDMAERLKIERGIALPDLIPNGEALEILTAGSGERLRLPRTVLGEIIEARMSELLEMAHNAISRAGVTGRLPAGVVLTGGGAMLPGAIELAQQVFSMPVRLGHPIELAGWGDQAATPQFSTGVGLLRFGLRQRMGAVSSAISSGATTSTGVTDNNGTLHAASPATVPHSPAAPSPGTPSPAATTPVATSPVATSPVAVSSPATQPARLEPASTTSDQTRTAYNEPAPTEPASTEPAKTGPRRIWSDSPPSPRQASAVAASTDDSAGDDATSTASEPVVGPRTLLARRHAPEAAVDHGDDTDRGTPFDRFRGPRAYDDNEPEGEGFMGLWQKFLTKLRQLIGFENS